MLLNTNLIYDICFLNWEKDGVDFQTRNSIYPSTQIGTSAAVSLPVCLRVSRTGTTYRSDYTTSSTCSSGWVLLDSRTISTADIPTSATTGMAASSYSTTGGTVTATYSNVIA